MVARPRGRADLLSVFSFYFFFLLGRVAPQWFMVCLFPAQNPLSRQIPAVIELSLFVRAIVRPPLTKARFGPQSRRLFWKNCAGTLEPQFCRKLTTSDGDFVIEPGSRMRPAIPGCV